jgi:hypothetical protein
MEASRITNYNIANSFYSDVINNYLFAYEIILKLIQKHVFTTLTR